MRPGWGNSICVLLCAPASPLGAQPAETVVAGVPVVLGPVNGVLIERNGQTLSIYGDPRPSPGHASLVLFTHHRRDVVWAGRALAARGKVSSGGTPLHHSFFVRHCLTGVVSLAARQSRSSPDHAGTRVVIGFALCDKQGSARPQGRLRPRARVCRDWPDIAVFCRNPRSHCAIGALQRGDYTAKWIVSEVADHPGVGPCPGTSCGGSAVRPLDFDRVFGGYQNL